MKFSYSWLQTYFEKKLPAPDALADILTMRIFEVEGVEAVGDDHSLDVKILPDRAGYAYAHANLAREINALTDAGFAPAEYQKVTAENVAATIGRKTADFAMPRVLIPAEVAEKVPVFTARIIDNISNSESPAWLQKSLQGASQRSISLIVDLTNYAMLDVGQPMHAFDADKVAGGISIRYATAGERLTLLDDREIELDSDTLVIADEEGALDIAGIKGGKKAEVDSNTRRIIITAGNFNASYIRKTSQKVGIKNDASKRYENGVTHERVFVAQNEFIHLLQKENPAISFGPLDVVGLSAESVFAPRGPILLDSEFVSEKIGADISIEKIKGILALLEIDARSIVGGASGDAAGATHAANSLEVVPPVYRSDLVIAEDVIEEIGRLNGYDSLEGNVPAARGQVPELKQYYYANVIRDALTGLGCSEVYLHTLVKEGAIALANPLTVDRSHLRSTLAGGILDALRFNAQHIDLLGDESSVAQDIRIFEIGNIFKTTEGRLSLSIGIGGRSGKGVEERHEREIAAICQRLQDRGFADASLMAALRTGFIKGSTPAEGGAVPASYCAAEFDLAAIIESLPDPAEFKSKHPEADAPGPVSPHVPRFVPFSPYPYIVRDIAVFMPGPTGRAQELRSLIESVNASIVEKGLADDGSPQAVHRGYIVRLRQFDEFEKKNKETGEIEKTSYGFRMVFQAPDRTLTDLEVQGVMDRILLKIAEQFGWEVR